MLHNQYRLNTVREVLEYYMENQGFQAESWADLSNMTNVFITVMGKKKLHELTPEIFNAYNSGRRRGTFGKRPAKSTGTLRRELTHLQTAIKFCARSRLINPEHVPYIPMPPKPAPRVRWLTKEEIQKMKDAAEPWSRGEIFLRIALATGARKRVIETLEWSQVNFQTNMITFAKPGDRQTKKKKPTVPMTMELKLYLQELKKRSNGSKEVMGHCGQIRWSLEAIANRAGVDGVTPHVLRHTWATHASMNRVSLGEIARVLGDSIVTVEKVYAKFQPGYLQDAIEQAAL